MTSYATPLWVLIMMLVWSMSMMGVAFLFFMKWFKIFKQDIQIFIDKNDRFRIFFNSIVGKTTIKRGKETYHLTPEGGLLNKKGKSLYIFSEGKPVPMMLQHDKAEWLDAETLSGFLSNRSLSQVVTPTNSGKELLILFGAIGGIIAMVASVVLLLIETGVISSVA